MKFLDINLITSLSHGRGYVKTISANTNEWHEYLNLLGKLHKVHRGIRVYLMDDNGCICLLHPLRFNIIGSQIEFVIDDVNPKIAMANHVLLRIYYMNSGFLAWKDHQGKLSYNPNYIGNGKYLLRFKHGYIKLTVKL